MLPGAAGGPFALALSARSDVLKQFGGGPGQIAMHGVANLGGTPGTAVSWLHPTGQQPYPLDGRAPRARRAGHRQALSCRAEQRRRCRRVW